MIGRLARFGGSFAVLAAVLWWVGAEEVLARVQGASLGWLALAFLALTLSTLSMARRWQITAHSLGLDLGYRAAVREYYLSLLVNAVLPGGVVGDVSRAIRLRHSGDLKRAAQSVLAERLLGQAAMLVILVVGLGLSLTKPGGIAWPNGTATGLSVGLLITVGVLLALGVARQTKTLMLLCIRLCRQPSISLHAFAGAAALLLALYACAQATGTALSFEASVTILPLVFCAMLIPLSIAGWGWREGAAAALFPLIGVSPEAGIAMGLCYGAAMLAAALPGLALIIRVPRAVGLEGA